jgi:DEAD/DEAH box helicase domain-containing protein
MLPSVVATQLRNCVADYLHTTFRPTTPGFEGLMERFLARETNYCQGPYLSIGLPFRPSQTGANFFKDIPLKFNPHLHQERAFQRLAPPYYQSTLVATGTGSGKTECFLMPLLEHCRQQIGTPGIKAILIYPMNALATDQAKRIARLIHSTPALQGKVTAGLYVGDEDDKAITQMESDTVITDKPTLREQPPDILLTNYKMLDYLLIQPNAQPLWRHNQANPPALRYIIVDEFHTFDGAQGTDLACLLRRLKHRLKTPKNHLVCVGTSATLGGGDNKSEMLNYAAKIFDEPFDTEDNRALIEEDRITANEFLYADPDTLVNPLPIPGIDQLNALQPDRYGSPLAYLRAQARLWLQEFAPTASGKGAAGDDGLPTAWCLHLGKELKTLPIVQNLLRKLSEGTKTYADILDLFGRRLGLPADAPPVYTQLLFDSLLSLMAVARREVTKPDGTTLILPWVSLRVQYWFRELRRMVATVAPLPELLFSTDLTNQTPEPGETTPPKTLPVLHCRDCGATGWGGVEPHQGAKKLEPDALKSFYQAYFNRKPLVAFIFPCDETQTNVQQFCGQCLTINDQRHTHCRSCGNPNLIRVHIPDNTREESRNGQKHSVVSHDCPYCRSSSGLTILGAQASSLTSAMIGVLYTTPYNPDKKLLAFSDSVQDAAHRAGFYGARTYRTTLRTAIAQVVATLNPHPPIPSAPAEGAGVRATLQDLLHQFPGYWQSRFGSTADYVATFLPTDLAWLREWEDFLHSDKTDLPTDSRLLNLVNERLTWEIVNQFGHRAAVGPSLERSGICATYFAPNRLDQVVTALHLRLTNEIEALRVATPEQVRQFLLGLLHHLRQRGGLLQPATANYIAAGGNTFLWQKYTYMPKIGPTVPRPIFYVNASAKADSFEAVIRPDKRNSWCEDWTTRVFSAVSLLLKEQLGEILHQALTGLVEGGLLEARPCNGGQAWGIPLEALYLGGEATVLSCDRCSHQVTTSPLEQASLEGMACLKINCPGHYAPDPRTGLAYYRQIYRHGEVERIVAAEHTGLLSRTNRETLEQRFIESTRRCDPNLISATSTLEMGIDIGDLSTVFLSSVPPGPANLKQRSGRAGRRDGNALITVIANGKPHDLFFYANPIRMLEGKIETAGCYLDASAILQRQLTAFCLDNWVATGLSRQAFPHLLSDVLNAMERNDQKRFPYNWLEFLQGHQGEVLDTFLRLFENCTESRTRQELRIFMEKGEQEEGGLRFRVLDALNSIRKERTRLSTQIKALGSKIKKIQEEPEALQDQERLEELSRERSGFRALMKDLNQKPTLSFLTDEGLLPNYAFPEAGVTLRSILWRRRQEADGKDGKKYETYPISYERPGRLAIRELVPSGVFYAEGRRVKIDQVDLKLSEPEEWRFCRSCNYSIQVFEPEAREKVCPRCQDSMWSDQGQVRRMLRLKQVMATTSDRDSRFGDDSEDRNTAFFQRHLLVDFDSDYREKTFLVNDEEFPFGFEYISRTSFREINLGEPTANGESVTIGGQKYKSQGFRVCRSCGKVMRGNSKKDHTISCQFRDKPDQAKALDVLYLYREFESEAIRFLMPDDNFWTAEGLHSFIAALQLGLKQKFGGQVGHLHTTISEEPQPNSTLRKSFLYLFDSVPGGTGYLRQLIRNPDHMRDVFDQALKVVRACGCQAEGKDGCYECLFAYRNSFDQDRTSRRRGQSLLSAISKHWPNLAETSTGLSAIRLNSNFESELERRFIEAIRRYRLTPAPDPSDSQETTLRKDTFNGKTGYYLKIGQSAWVIETQVSLGEAQGVAIPCRADFLIRPASVRLDSKPIVIFTDGWDYHKDRIGHDFEQRLAILRSHQFWCWSLTWDDVAKQLEPEYGVTGPDGLNHRLNPQFQSNPVGMHQKYGCNAMAALEKGTSFEWLMHYLANPSATTWQQWGLLRTLAQANASSFTDSNLQSQWSQQIQTLLGDLALDYWGPPAQFISGDVPVSSVLRIWHAADLTRHAQLDPTGSLVVIQLDDLPADHLDPLKHSWNEALRLLNLYQFLPHVYAITTTAINQGQQPLLADPPVSQKQPASAVTAADQGWVDLRSAVLDEDLLVALDQMEQESWPRPEVGYELANERGKVIAEAELAWPGAKVAVLLTDDDQDVWAQAGWCAFTVDQFASAMGTIKDRLPGA